MKDEMFVELFANFLSKNQEIVEGKGDVVMFHAFSLLQIIALKIIF